MRKANISKILFLGFFSLALISFSTGKAQAGPLFLSSPNSVTMPSTDKLKGNSGPIFLKKYENNTSVAQADSPTILNVKPLSFSQNRSVVHGEDYKKPGVMMDATSLLKKR